MVPTKAPSENDRLPVSGIGWGVVAISAILVLVAVAISKRRHLGLEASLLWAAFRAVVQLTAVGLLAKAVFDSNFSLTWAWCWIVFMLLIASETLRRRGPELSGLFKLGLCAFGLSCLLVLGVLFGLGVFELEALTLVPIAGLLIGNGLATSVLVMRRVYGEISDHQDEIEARLALGQTSSEASAPFIRQALRTALVPQIETTKAVGLVVLPGAMTGLILAGVDPLDAVRVQIAVMFVVLGTAATTSTVIALGVRNRLFTKDQRLVRIVRPAASK